MRVLNRTGIENKYENVCLTGAKSLPSHKSRVITRPAVEHIYYIVCLRKPPTLTTSPHLLIVTPDRTSSGRIMRYNV